MGASRTDGQGPETQVAHEKETAPEAHRNGLLESASAQPKIAVWLADFALIALFTAALRSPTLSISVFDADESAFIIAAREALQGHLPYQTFWDHKPLGSTMIIAAAMALFGESIETVRAVGMACVIATGWFLHEIAWRALADRVTALAAALFYIAFSTRIAGLGLMNEILFAPFTAAGVLLLLSVFGERRDLNLILAFAAAGLAFGIGVWIKYVPAIPAAFISCFALIAVLLRPDRGAVRAIALGTVFAAGLLLPTLASAFLYWRSGALDEFLYANFGFALTYMELAGDPRGALFVKLRWASVAVVQIWPLMALTAAAFLPPSFRFFRDKSRVRESAVVGLWLAAEFLAVILQTKFYDYQFLVTLPPMSIVAAAAITFYAREFALPPKVARASAAAIAFIVLVPVVPHVRETAATHSRPDVPREVARMISEELPTNRRVYVVDYQPIIYFLSKAPLPTRYAFPVHLVGYQTLGNVDLVAELQRLLESRPEYIVMNEMWRADPLNWNSQAMMEVEKVLRAHYIPHAAWTLPDSRGIIRLFILHS